MVKVLLCHEVCHENHVPEVICRVERGHVHHAFLQVYHCSVLCHATIHHGTCSVTNNAIVIKVAATARSLLLLTCWLLCCCLLSGQLLLVNLLARLCKEFFLLKISLFSCQFVFICSTLADATHFWIALHALIQAKQDGLSHLLWILQQHNRRLLTSAITTLLRCCFLGCGGGRCFASLFLVFVCLAAICCCLSLQLLLLLP